MHSRGPGSVSETRKVLSAQPEVDDISVELHAEVQSDTVVKPPKPREYPVCPEQSSQCVTEQTIGETVGRGSCPAKPSLLGQCYTEADAWLTEAVL